MLFNVRSKLTADLESPADKFGVSIGPEAKSFSAAFAVRAQPQLYARLIPTPSQWVQDTLQRLGPLTFSRPLSTMLAVEPRPLNEAPCH